MNFYKRFIGDIQRDTGHLSLAEFGAYDRLLDHYYATETPLPSDVDACCRIARAMTKDERKAVSNILNQYFTPTDAGFIQKRVEAELAFLAKHGRWSDEKSLINRAFNQAMRHARKLKATPKWLSDEHRYLIKAIHIKCKALSNATNVQHHVDHIVPLQGKLVCGLNVPWNLQILTATDNCKKSNKVTYE